MEAAQREVAFGQKGFKRHSAADSHRLSMEPPKRFMFVQKHLLGGRTTLSVSFCKFAAEYMTALAVDTPHLKQQ